MWYFRKKRGTVGKTILHIPVIVLKLRQKSLLRPNRISAPFDTAKQEHRQAGGMAYMLNRTAWSLSAGHLCPSAIPRISSRIFGKYFL